MADPEHLEERTRAPKNRRDWTWLAIAAGLVAGAVGFSIEVRAQMHGQDNLSAIVLAGSGGVMVILTVVWKFWQQTATHREAVARETWVNYQHFKDQGITLTGAEAMERRFQNSKKSVADRRQRLESEWRERQSKAGD